MVWTIPVNLHSEIVQSAPCPFAEHSYGTRDNKIPRYSDSCACVRCCARFAEGRISLDIHKIHRAWRKRFLRFWSFVELQSPDTCWDWHGLIHRGSAYFRVPRHWSSTPVFSASRFAVWTTWGDIGRLPLERLCDNKFCVNPLHYRAKGIPHFRDGRGFDKLDLEFSVQKLMNETNNFIHLSKVRAPDFHSLMIKEGGQWLRDRIDLLEDQAQEEEEEET